MTAGESLPWFPVYVMDWLTSETIGRFTLEQEAVYYRLLMRQWIARDGYLTNNETTLAEWARLKNGRWRTVGKPVIQQCFVRRAGGRYCNVKLRSLWHDAQLKSEQARRAARKRWKRPRRRKR